jgi:hypothetical protein
MICPECAAPPCYGPYPCDCTQFIKCDSGTPSVYFCPTGLEWNDAVKLCDWPSNANCEPVPDSTPSPTPSPTPATTPVPDSTPSPTPSPSPTPATTPAPAPTLQVLTISLANQIIGKDKVHYLHTHQNLNVELNKPKATSPIPTGKITFYQGSKVLGNQTLINGKAKWIISSIPKQFQGLNKIEIVYSGDKTYKTRTTIFPVFFFTIPRTGNYIINTNQSTIKGHNVTYFNSNPNVWKNKNKLAINRPFYGWAKSPKQYNCQTSFDVKISSSDRERYDFMGVIGVERIGTRGIRSSTKIANLVIVDTRDESKQGVGEVVASFCSAFV